MDAESLKGSAGKKCRIIIKNGFNYTAIIPKLKEWDSETTITIIDKFSNTIRIDIGSISAIHELE